MNSEPATPSHIFLGADHRLNERKTWSVVALTGTMMAIEIICGWLFNSLALLADGFHMATHAGVMLIAALAYAYSRRYAEDPRFVFGTAKIGDLASFVSALFLGLMALLIVCQSVGRFIHPAPVVFGEAMLVAAIGFVVNLACALILHEGGQSHPPHVHAEDKPHHHHHDNNFRAAYIHVVMDMATSLAAVLALAMGKYVGLSWMDPAAGLLGSLVILNWSYVLIKSAAAVLLDMCPDTTLADEVRETLKGCGAQLNDFHLWRVGPGHFGLVVSLRSDHPTSVDDYKACLDRFESLSHITIEVIKD